MATPAGQRGDVMYYDLFLGDYEPYIPPPLWFRLLYWGSITGYLCFM